MGYKQTDNPFTKLNNSFTSPKVARRKVRQSEALKWNMPDFNSIVETKADGSTVTEDKKTENTTGTDKEGSIPEAQEGQDGMNAAVVNKMDQVDARIDQSKEARAWKGEKKGRKKHERQNKRDIKHYTKGINRGEVDEDDEGYQEALARQGYYDTHDTKGKDWHEVEDDFQAGNKKRLKSEADAKWIEESISDMENQDWYKEDQEAEDERVQAEMTERLNRFKKEDDLAEANKKQANAAPGMYKNKNMKQVNSKGDAFPMVAQQPQTNPYGQEEQTPNRAGRSPQSNQLINDPNINQPLNKVANSSFETNEKFSQIASDPGQLYDQPQGMENVAGNTPAYGAPAWKRKKQSGTTKRGAEISITTNKKRDGEAEDAALDHSTIGRTDIFNRPTPDTPNTVTYSKTNKKGKTKSITAKGGTRKSDRLHKKYARKVNKGTKGETEYDKFDEGLGMYGGEDPVKKMHNNNPYKLNPSIPTKPTKKPKKKKKEEKSEATPNVVQGFIDAQGQAMYNGPSNEKGKVKLDGKEVTYNKGGMRENLTKQGVISKDGKITPEIMNKAEEGDYGSLAKKQANFAENAFGFTGTAMEKHTKVTKSNYKAAEKDDAAHASYLKRDVKDIQKSHMSQAKKDAWETADEKHISKLYGDLKYDHGHHGRKYDNV